MDKKDGGPIDLESLRGFTPGPWRLSGVDVVNGDDHWCINGHALVEGFHSPTDCRLATVYTIEANARLIAAAPSMHAELTARRARDAEAVRRQDMTTNDKLADALRNLIRAGKHLRNTVVETRGVAGMDDHDVAISDSIAALAEHDAQPAPAPVQVEGWWRVEVSDSAGQIVAIEPGMLAGRDVGCGSDDATIRLVVEHLRSFIGEPAHPPAPAADGAGELPRYGIRWNGPTQPISVPIGDGYWTPWHLAHAAIAALRQPVPDAVREEVVGAIAKPATGWDVAGNYGDGKWRAFRLEKQQTYLGDPKSSEMEAIAETHRLAALASQQESRNAD